MYNIKLYKIKIKTKRNRYISKIVPERSREQVVNYINSFFGNVKIIYIKSAEPLKDKIDNYFNELIGVKKSKEAAKKELIKKAKKIKPLEVARFLNRFAESTRASRKPIDILHSLLQENFSYKMKMLFLEIEEEINKGNTLSKSMSVIPRLTPEIIEVLSIGESTGKIPETLEQIAQEIELEVSIKRKIRGGLTKPIGTLVFAFGIILFIIPKMINPIKEMFDKIGNGAHLPLLTRIVIGVTDFLAHNVIFISGGIFSLFLLNVFLYKNKYKYKLFIDRIIISIPIIGTFLRDLLVLKILVTLNMYISSGISLNKALFDISKTITNSELKEEFTNVIFKEVEGGKKLSEALAQSIYFNDFIKGEIYAAEKEGSLLKKISQIIYILDTKITENSEKMISRLTSVISFSVSILVGVIVVATYSPMFSLIGKMNKQLTQ